MQVETESLHNVSTSEGQPMEQVPTQNPLQLDTSSPIIPRVNINLPSAAVRRRRDEDEDDANSGKARAQAMQSYQSKVVVTSDIHEISKLTAVIDKLQSDLQAERTKAEEWKATFQQTLLETMRGRLEEQQALIAEEQCRTSYYKDRLAHLESAIEEGNGSRLSSNQMPLRLVDALQNIATSRTVEAPQNREQSINSQPQIIRYKDMKGKVTGKGMTGLNGLPSFNVSIVLSYIWCNGLYWIVH